VGRPVEEAVPGMHLTTSFFRPILVEREIPVRKQKPFRIKTSSMYKVTLTSITQPAFSSRTLLTLVIIFFAFTSGPSILGAPAASSEGQPTEDSGGKLEVQVPPPPLSDLFPCSQCHADMKVNPKRRKLTEMHDDIILKHDEENRWCLDCHNPDDRDKLRLASGKLIDFSESYRLCGQCHGPKYRDWKAGVHGKRTGSWNGEKQYLLCVHCHDPHSPHFKPIKPMPPPVRPENLR
jgi:hypothetical protein